MKYFVLLCLISYAFSMFSFFQSANTNFFYRTYFGEYFQCSLFDLCSEEYQTCLQDNECSYQMFSSPCIDPCGVDYGKFFEQMRGYQQTYNDSQNIATFPVASCAFTTCQTNWIASLNNTILNALKTCEMKNCLQAYPSYTFIAHEYAELTTCGTLVTACEQSAVCKQAADILDACIEEKGFHVDPRTNPDQYFHEHVNTFDNPIIQCLQAPETIQDPAYQALYNCIKPIWTK